MAGPALPTDREEFAADLVDQLATVMEEAERQTRPLELEPYRGRLFALFVQAERAGLVADDADPDLSSDGVSRRLAARWDLADAARASLAQQTRIPAADLSKMRLLWSLLRMWMEWTYAWQRWPEFHASGEHRTP